MIGYLLACFVAAILLLGGFGAAMASIRLGKAELVARVVLAGFSGIAIVAALVLGIGVNPAFCDAVLRRYPLSAGDRFLTRRITAFLDPLWMILLALFMGLAAGFHAVGVGSIWLAVLAALLLVIVTYLFAQLLAAMIGWITATPAGPAILAVLVVILVFAVSAAPAIGANRSLSAALLPVVKVTPAFCAAGVMAGGSAIGLLLLLVWCAAMAAAIAGVERLPVPSQTVAAARAEWDGPVDRLVAHFGSSAPLVAKTLKYYWRTKRARFSLLINAPAFPLMLVIMRPDRHAPLLHFFIGVGLMAIIGFSVTFAMAINSFGFDGSGFRRYFLLPLAPTAVVRAVSLIPLLLGALTLPVGFAVCVLLARVPIDARMATMLAANGVGGLCFFQALALWTSMLTPSRTDGEVRFGNDYSLAANLVGSGGIVVSLVGSQFLGVAAGARALQFWWVAPFFMVAAVAFYALSLCMAPAVLVSRRERILAVVEREQQGGRLIT
ncbi:MAG TPA: hypothetical protein VLE22_27955 [Bryobacteraceae bacterium]|nr:hypothetical protein [Bryobacteraceae bacterium]